MTYSLGSMISMPLCGLQRIAWSIAAIVCIAGMAASPAGAADRFDGDVAGAATGPGHEFTVGDGLYLRFRDSRRSYTDYRVCWTRGLGFACWDGTTGRIGSFDPIFTAAPEGVGTYTVKWRVGDRVVARWSFDNAIP
jgi:hypothetical protein